MHPIKVAVHEEQVAANAKGNSPEPGSPMEGSDGGASSDAKDVPQQRVRQGTGKGKHVASVSDDIEDEMDKAMESTEEVNLEGVEVDETEDSAQDFINATMFALAANIAAEKQHDRAIIDMFAASLDKMRT